MNDSRKDIEALPVALTSMFDTFRHNEALPIFSGEVVLKEGALEVKGTGNVRFRWCRSQER
jgi:hypothetical protein